MIELVTVVMILAILALVAAPLLAEGFRAYFTGVDARDAERQATLALERMSREVRRADAITNVSSTRLELERDGGTVVFEFRNGALWRDAGGESKPLARRVNGGAFQSLDNARTRYYEVRFSVADLPDTYRTRIAARRPR